MAEDLKSPPQFPNDLGNEWSIFRDRHARRGCAAQATRRLIVGREIYLSGEITACDTLVVEGRRSDAKRGHRIEITESGYLKVRSI